MSAGRVLDADVDDLYHGSDELPALVAEAARRVRARRAVEGGAGYPRDRWQLQAWIREVTGWHIPGRAVCARHRAPLDFVWSVFNEELTEAVVLANRGGGKTFNIAALHLANGYFKAGHQTAHLGAIDTQARRAYAYYLRGVRAARLRPLVPDPHITSTDWTHGSHIEVLPATEAQTQGGHHHVVSYDELDSGKYQPFENAKGMPVERRRPDGTVVPGIFVVASTRNSVRGLMQRALEEAAERGTPVFEWCVLDTMAPCDVPADSPLWEWLPPEGLSLADGWRSYDDVLAVFNRVDRDTWLAQYLNLVPEQRALIYPTFTDANVTERAEWVPGAGQLYLAYDWGFTDPAALLLVQFRPDGDWEERPDGRRWVPRPGTEAFWQFAELVGAGRSEREWVREVVRLVVGLEGYEGPDMAVWERIWRGRAPWPDPWPLVWPDAAGDPSAAQLRSELREHGIGVRKPASVRHPVESGQDVLRAAFHAGEGTRRYFVHPRCVETIAGLRNLRARRLPDGGWGRTPDPAPENHRWSHAPDAARYLVWAHRAKLGLSAPAADDARDPGEPGPV